MKNQTKQQILQKDNFTTVYNQLKSKNYCILGSSQPIQTDREIAAAGSITIFKDLFCWQYFGGSANKATKTDLKWILQTIFDNCEYFLVIEKNKYYNTVSNYYDNEIQKRQRELNQK